jgi:hypothetical protein
LIECREPPTVPDREREKVDVGELSRAENPLAVEKLCVEERDIVGQNT